MNLTKLFNTQRELDERIVKEKGLEGAYLIDRKITALLVELGELANETRCFKYWSEKPPSPREVQLEEFVDGVHFFISLANEFEIEPKDFEVTDDYTKETATATFNEVFMTVGCLNNLLDVNLPATVTMDDIRETLHEAFSCYVGLAEKFLGFTWQEIESAYFAKNEINHKRQDSGVY